MIETQTARTFPARAEILMAVLIGIMLLLTVYAITSPSRRACGRVLVSVEVVE